VVLDERGRRRDAVELVGPLAHVKASGDELDGVTASATLIEHHGSPDGYLPAPIVLAAAIAGRTRQLAISITVVLPLYHALRLAEDLAVLDLISRGRVKLTLAAGYRSEEFAAFGVHLADRGRLMEEGLETLEQAWTGEPFDFRKATARVTPRPFQRPRPPITLGGSSKAAARRAARMADGFRPTNPELIATYRDELVALGKDPGPSPSASGPPVVQTLVAVSDDPDEVWRAVGPHCLHEMNSYAAWLRDGSGASGPFWEVGDVDSLRYSGRYAVLTPEQCVQRATDQGGMISIAPLTGGIAPELSWQSMRLIESRVLPRLAGA
jgi:alkanesulfonate monooxygenase SsuD/methylene tetrahydromethanopterin reductase-like flavin-dependent oxidoreductase (luciferase family)